jgi:hypothetical protein
MLRGRHGAILALSNVRRVSGDQPESPEKLQAELAVAEEEKKLAQAQVDGGFPLIYEQSTIALWAALESVVRTFVAAWLQHREGAWQNDEIKKLKVKLGDFMSLEPLERSLWVIDLLDQEESGPLRSGINRFENLLRVFGLDGKVPKRCAKILFELSQVRHVLVHRTGIADKKLLDACPWMRTKRGNRIRVTRQMWKRYNVEATNYILELIQRTRVQCGHRRYRFRKDANNKKISLPPMQSTEGFAKQSAAPANPP